jgi:hypothetical protein
MINQDLERRIEAYRGNPQALMQKYQQSQQLIDLLALQKIKSEKEAAARSLQMTQPQQPMPTVAEQREQEVMGMARQEVAERIGEVAQQKQQQQQQAMQRLMGGLAAAPGAQGMMPVQAMRAGGIVGYNGEEESMVAAASEYPEEQAPYYSDRLPMSEEERQRLRDMEYDETRRLMRRFPRGEPQSLAERQRRQREEKGSIYSEYFGMTPSERAAAQFGKTGEGRTDTQGLEAQEAARVRGMRDRALEGGLPQILERQERQVPSIVPDALKRLVSTPAEPAYLQNVREALAKEEAARLSGPDAQEQQALQVSMAQSRPEERGLGSTPPAMARAAAPEAPRPRLAAPDQARIQQIAQAGAQPGQPAAGGLPDFSREITAGIQRYLDPAAAAAERSRAEVAARAAYGRTPEEQALIQRHIKELEDEEKRRFSPEAIRQRRLDDFLMGAMNKTSTVGALSGGAKSAIAGGRAVEEAKQRFMTDRQKRIEDFIESQRRIRGEVFGKSEEAGKAMTEQAGKALTTAGQVSGDAQRARTAQAQMANELLRLGIERESAERIARLRAETDIMQAEATRAGNLLQQQDRLLQRVTENEQRAIAELAKSPTGLELKKLRDMRAEMGGKLTPAQETQLKNLEATYARQEDLVRKDFQAQRNKLEMSGFTVIRD